MSPVSTKRADTSGTCPRPRALARRRRPRRHAHALLRLHRRHQHSMVDRERVLVVSSSPPADGEGLRHHALARVTRPLGHEGDDPPAAILLGDPTATAAWCIARTEKEDPPVVPCTDVQAAALRIVTQGSRSRGSSRRAPYVSRGSSRQCSRSAPTVRGSSKIHRVRPATPWRAARRVSDAEKDGHRFRHRGVAWRRARGAGGGCHRPATAHHVRDQTLDANPRRH